ncbi:DUF4340 domain-containing protein [Kordiimonas sp.]|uniref:DUF4340 domain-containing protein n=1 Tax=Kordiimonas sp. TaxID=1970157 RepID=UPI003A91A25D
MIAILGAIWVMFGEDPARDQGARGEATFEGLADRINDAAGIAVGQGDTTTHLNKVGGEWRVIERDGYKADRAVVNDFLRGLALSERREPKTSNEQRFDKLGLGDDALAIKVLDSDDNALLSFQMGTRKDSPNGRSLTYIFQKKDTRSWLVSGLANTSADPAWWLDAEVLDVAENRFSRISYGDIRLERPLGDSKYVIADLVEGEIAQADWQLRDPARVLSNLNFDDVRKMGNPLTDPVGALSAETYDGLAVRLTLFEISGAVWAQVSADYDADHADEGESGTLPAAPADGAAEAAAIIERTRGWLFKLSDYDAKVLLRKRADFLAGKPTEE